MSHNDPARSPNTPTMLRVLGITGAILAVGTTLVCTGFMVLFLVGRNARLRAEQNESKAAALAAEQQSRDNAALAKLDAELRAHTARSEEALEAATREADPERKRAMLRSVVEAFPGMRAARKAEAELARILGDE